jgi:hypothetical protein
MPWSRFLVLCVTVSTTLACDAGPGDARAPTAGERERLEALGYADWVDPGEDPRDGVVTWDRARAQPGYTLYTSRGAGSGAVLVDLTGRIAHRWEGPPPRQTWHHAVLLEDGSVLAIERRRRLLKVDRDSQLAWEVPLAVHHDIRLREDGRILTLATDVVERPFRGASIPIAADFVVELAPDGRELRRWSLLDLLGDRVPESAREAIAANADALRNTPADEVQRSDLDVLHTNSLEILTKPIPGIAPAGALLLSVRELDLVVIVDLAAQEVLWEWGPVTLQRQHDASLTEDGAIRIFDNGLTRQHSRVLEVDLHTKEVRFELGTIGGRKLWSRRRGGAQKLPNGHLLITEGDRGRIVEVTRSGEIVWEYLNPQRKPDADIPAEARKRAAIYRARRYAIDELPWLNTENARGTSIRRPMRR